MPVADTAQQPTQPAKTSKPAPAGVPQSLKDRLDRDWPLIKSEADAFLAKFEEAKTARGSDDRAAMASAIEAARQHYSKAKDKWAEIAYWPSNELDDGNIDQRTHDACERWLGTYSRQVKAWDKKAKGLKELSTVR